jgi:glycosyltransferase involved in cell wall biosynthesis
MASYNRADTIERAIHSVKAQTLHDWELIIVDDGSTDDTISRVDLSETRIRLIRQENQGFVGARNTGLRACTGKYISFLDSDDEWLPYHLELCVSFLETFPDEQFVASELLEDFGQGRIVNHYRIETSEWYPSMARQIGAHSFELPAGTNDHYLRVYEKRESIGSWGRDALRCAGIQQEAFVYSGRIFEKLCWGYLIAVNSLVLRRSALETVGLEDPAYNIAADYHFIATLCRQFRANFIGLPTYVKHELTSSGDVPFSDHIATGSTGLVCAQDMLRSFDDLFWRERKDDPELSALRALKLFSLAQTSLQYGKRADALQYLKASRNNNGSNRIRSFVLEAFVRCLPGAELTRKGYGTLNRVSYAGKQLVRGELSPLSLLRKTLSQLRLGTTYNRPLFWLVLTRIVTSAISEQVTALSDAVTDYLS